MKTLLGTAVICFTLALASPVQSAIIVDTGVTGTSGFSLVNSAQELAGRFDLTDEYRITSVLGWFGSFTDSQPGQLAIQIYEDSGSPSQPGSVVQSLAVTMIAGEATGWTGMNGLDWVLDAGTYWVGFGSLSGFRAKMPQGGAANPMDRYGFEANGTTWFTGNVASKIGVRIEGDLVSAVPLPSSALLLLGGLGLLAVRRRDRLARNGSSAP